MLEGRYEKLEFQKMFSSSYRKIEASKSKAKVLKKEPREMENQRKKDKKNDPSRDKKMILGLITLKHNLGLFILSFETINPSPHYVHKKSILIECGYLH